MDCRRDLMPSAAGRSRRGRRCGRVLRWRRWKGPPKGCCRAAAAPTNRSHRSTWNSMVADERGADVPRCGGEGARAGSSPIRRQCAKPRRKQAAGDLMVSAHHKKKQEQFGAAYLARAQAPEAEPGDQRRVWLAGRAEPCWRVESFAARNWNRLAHAFYRTRPQYYRQIG